MTDDDKLKMGAKEFGKMVGLLDDYNSIVEDYLTVEAHLESQRLTRKELVEMAKGLEIYTGDERPAELTDAIVATLRQKLWLQIMTVKEYVDKITK